MTQRVLILGGSGFLGHALVAAALERGAAVTTFNRGRRAPADPRVTLLTGDRERAADIDALEGDWDIVVDTWSGAPRAVSESASRLEGRAGAYVYVSSCSVYGVPAMGVSESAATVAADPDAAGGEYPALKRGGELAAARVFGDRALLLRPGLILGPHEDVGRLPWWLARMARGGEVLAPGPPELPLQYIDARDLAAFAFDAAAAGVGGPVNAVGRRGLATMQTLLDSCREVAGAPGTTLRWVAAEAVLSAGIEPWMDLPVWIPPGHEYEAMHDADTARAESAGLRTRPLHATVADTWAWLRSLDGPPPQRPDLPTLGLDPERERAVLAGAAQP